MSDRQAKLLRYFEKSSGDHELSKQIRKAWPYMTIKAKGKLTKWLKKVVVTLMAIKEAKRQEQYSRNLNVLKGFTV